jgi:SSS family solute:Na+ symporter
LDNHNDLYGIIISSLIPSGVLGLVLAGLIAAMMSSIDSALNSSATLIVYDFINSRRKPLSDRRMVSLGRGMVMLVMGVSLLWTPIIANFGGIWAYSQTMLTYFVSPLVGLFFLGIFNKTGGQKNALIALMTGHLFSIVFIFLNLFQVVHLHFSLIAPILFLITILSFFVSIKVNAFLKEENDINISLKELWISFKLNEVKRLSIYFYLGLGLVILTLLTIFPFLI